MSTLYLMCGLPGSGKTTCAKQIETAHAALRLCPDEWIDALLPDKNDAIEMDRLRSTVEAIQWNIAKRTLALGLNVVLENGFWSRNERTQYRSQAEALGADVELIYLKLDRDALWKRLAARNDNLPTATFKVREDQLDLWLTWFEAPSIDEIHQIR